MKKKSTLTRKIVLYLLIAAAIFTGLSAVFSWLEKTQRNYAVLKRDIVYTNLEAQKEGSFDVLILGDSETYASISPLQLWNATGICAYVAGQPGQRPAESYSLLQDALKKQKLKLVVLETDGLGKSYIQEAVRQRLSYFLPLLRTHNIWKEWVNGSYTTDVNFKGFRIRQGIGSYSGSSDYMTKKGNGRQLGIVDYVYVSRMKKLCERNGARLMLISVPSPKNYNRTRLDNLEAFASRLGLSYLDLNQSVSEIGLDWKTDTFDGGDHLNLFGAQKVTSWLETHFFTQQGLTDHRGDASYEDWNREYEAYAETVDKVTAKMLKNESAQVPEEEDQD